LVKAGVRLVVILLVCASVNVPFAVTKIRSGGGVYGVLPKQYGSEDAARLGWVIDTPEDEDWLPPDYWMVWRRFGYREYHIARQQRRGGGGVTHLRLQRLGWPVAVLEVRRFDMIDPRSGLSAPRWAPRPTILQLGLLANPLIVGVPIWGLFFAAPLAWKAAVRERRAGQGRCPSCGKKKRENGTCPEYRPAASD